MTTKKLVVLVEERQLEVHPHDAGQDDRGQGDRRDDRERLHDVVRALRGPAEVEVERADEQLAGVLDPVDRPLEPLARRRARSARAPRAARSRGATAGGGPRGSGRAPGGAWRSAAGSRRPRRGRARRAGCGRPGGRARRSASSMASIWRKYDAKTASRSPAAKPDRVEAAELGFALDVLAERPDRVERALVDGDDVVRGRSTRSRT